MQNCYENLSVKYYFQDGNKTSKLKATKTYFNQFEETKKQPETMKHAKI